MEAWGPGYLDGQLFFNPSNWWFPFKGPLGSDGSPTFTRPWSASVFEFSDSSCRAAEPENDRSLSGSNVVRRTPKPPNGEKNGLFLWFSGNPVLFSNETPKRGFRLKENRQTHGDKPQQDPPA